MLEGCPGQGSDPVPSSSTTRRPARPRPCLCRQEKEPEPSRLGGPPGAAGSNGREPGRQTIGMCSGGVRVRERCTCIPLCAGISSLCVSRYNWQQMSPNADCVLAFSGRRNSALCAVHFHNSVPSVYLLHRLPPCNMPPTNSQAADTTLRSVAMRSPGT